MAHKSVAIEKIQESISDDDIIDLASKGLQPKQIATQLGLSRMAVSDCLDRWLGEQSIRLAEKTEHLRLVELARLDYIYEQVAPYAFPHYDAKLEMDIPPDKGLLELMVKVIKEKREWDKSVSEARRKDRDNPTNVNIEHIEVTISQTNPLYDTAMQNVNEERWSRYADMDISELYTPPTTIPGKPVRTEDQIDEVAPYVENFEALINRDDEEVE